MENNTSDCYRSAGVDEVRERTRVVNYYALMPAYFLIGMFGNVLLLLAFREQSRKEGAYVYQLLLTVSKMLEAFTYTLFVIVYEWLSNVESQGVAWFNKNYALMWYTAHASIPLMNCFTTSSLLFSLVMAADRSAALAVPFKYKNLNHSLYHKIAAALCFSVGVSSNVFDCFRYTVVPDGDSYRIRVDKVYVASKAAVVLSGIRLVIRLGGLIGLIGLNAAMTTLFRKRAEKVAEMVSSDQRRQRDADKVLLLLTVWQSSLTCFGIIPINSVYILAYVAPRIIDCWGDILFLAADMAFSVAETINFFAVLTINKRLRQIIRNVLPCHHANVAPIAMSATNRQQESRRVSVCDSRRDSVISENRRLSVCEHVG